MLGTFPKDFHKWQLPKGIFPSGNFPNVKFTKRQLPKSVLATALSSHPVLAALLGPWPILAAALGSHCSPRRLRGPNLTFGKLPLRKLHIWELLLLGKIPLGKYLIPIYYILIPNILYP